MSRRAPRCIGWSGRKDLRCGTPSTRILPVSSSALGCTGGIGRIPCVRDPLAGRRAGKGGPPGKVCPGNRAKPHAAPSLSICGNAHTPARSALVEAPSWLPGAGQARLAAEPRGLSHAHRRVIPSRLSLGNFLATTISVLLWIRRRDGRSFKNRQKSDPELF